MLRPAVVAVPRVEPPSSNAMQPAAITLLCLPCCPSCLKEMLALQIHHHGHMCIPAKHSTLQCTPAWLTEVELQERESRL